MKVIKVAGTTSYKQNVNTASFKGKVYFSFPDGSSEDTISQIIHLIVEKFDFVYGKANMPTDFADFSYNSTKRIGSFNFSDDMLDQAKRRLKKLKKEFGISMNVKSFLSKEKIPENPFQ